MENILYVYSNCSPNKYKNLVESSGIMVLQQAQKYHQLMLEGIAANNCNVLAISSLPVNRELTKKLFFKTEDDTSGKINYRYLQFVNLPIFRNISIFINSFIFSLKKKGYINICDILNISITAGALLSSKFTGNISVGIVTDVPGFFADGRNNKVPFIQIINRWLLSKFDSYLFLTSQMNALINKKNRPFAVIEGHVDIDMKSCENTLENKYEKKVCLYAGSLKRIYGIDMLVEGFILANIENAELHIYGDGDYSDRLSEITNRDKRVKFFGVMPNRYIVAEQLKADLLINPRPTNEEYTKYSFPSKNMEYMASGTPTLTTRLPGMPDEYHKYVYLIEQETVEGISIALTKILSKSKEELHEKGLQAKEYVIHNKNNLIQAKILLDMIKDIKKGKKDAGNSKLN